MNNGNDWSSDPSVRAMRRLFARMESGQKELLQRLGISLYDGRLRVCREDARNLFERMLSGSSAGRGGQNEGDAAVLYIHCLIQALEQHGLLVPAGVVRENDPLKGVVREALK